MLDNRSFMVRGIRLCRVLKNFPFSPILSLIISDIYLLQVPTLQASAHLIPAKRKICHSLHSLLSLSIPMKPGEESWLQLKATRSSFNTPNPNAFKFKSSESCYWSVQVQGDTVKCLTKIVSNTQKLYFDMVHA